MAVPAPCAAFTITPEASGSPQIALDWTHPGTGTPTSFELRRRRTGTSTWYSHIVATVADMGSPSPYTYLTASRPGVEWEVAAINADGRSTSNVTATFSGLVEGVWLIPHIGGALQSTLKVYVEAEETPWTRPLTAGVYAGLGRANKSVQLGDLYAEEGSVGGRLVTSYSVSADTWRERFETLIGAQRGRKIWLVSPHLLLLNVSILDPSLSPWNAQDNAYDCGFSYVEGL